MQHKVRHLRLGWQFAVAVCVFVSFCAVGRAQEASSQLIEVFWQSRVTVSLPGVTGVIVFDESICHAQVSSDQLQFVGLARGETVAIAWVRDHRVTIRVRVVERPAEISPPKLSGNALEAVGYGVAGTSMQAAVAPNGDPAFLLLHHFQLQQQNNRRRLNIRAQAQNSTVPGVRVFNANSASISYEDPQLRLTLIDFPLEVNGGMEAKVSPYSTYNAYMVRGADVRLRRAANYFELFAGTTIPSYYLRLSGSREVAGFNFTRRKESNLSLYTTTGWVASPFARAHAKPQRETSIFQTGGFAWRANEQWAVEGTAGVSTRGGLLQGTVSYTGYQVTAFLTCTTSAQDFPLNQLQLLFSGGSSLTAGTILRLSSRLAASLYFQHSATKPTAFFPPQGAADYLNPNLSFSLSRRQAITLNYAYRHHRSGFLPLGRNRSQKLDIVLNSQMGAGISNTAQLTLGSLNDRLGFNSQREFTVRDSFSFPVARGFLTVAFQHSRYDPSLVKRLNEQINLLRPDLQRLFELNPVVFAQSPELPLDIRALLESLRPADTQISASGQFRIGRVNLSPNVAYVRNTPGVSSDSRSYLFGYSLSYQATATLHFISSLANVLLFDSLKGQLQRTTVATLALNKSFTGGLQSPLPFRPPKGTIRGRVFRDLNLNGNSNIDEPGIAGVRVELAGGEAVLTDPQGRFEFSRLKPGAYRVAVQVDHFKEAVRLTSAASVSVELFEHRVAEVNFGIVNFGRVIGSVFNDHLLQGTRRPDSNGLPHVRLILGGNSSDRSIITDGTGDYEVSDIAPGVYQLTLDRTTVPANFVGPAEAISILVGPATTVVHDIPVRALRAISGRVYLRDTGRGSVGARFSGESGGPGSGSSTIASDAGADPALRPLAGLQVAVGQTVATTDADGSFILRNLPAGELTLRVVPARGLPPGLAVPTGRITLPREPVQVENATIVISNPRMLEYLVPPTTASDEPVREHEHVGRDNSKTGGLWLDNREYWRGSEMAPSALGIHRSAIDDGSEMARPRPDVEEAKRVPANAEEALARTEVAPTVPIPWQKRSSPEPSVPPKPVLGTKWRDVVEAKIADAHNRRGRELLNRGKYREAIEELSQAIRHQPGLALAYNARGFAYYLLRDYKHALADLDEAIRLNQRYVNAYHNRSVVRKAAGDAVGSAADAQKVRELGIRSRYSIATKVARP